MKKKYEEVKAFVKAVWEGCDWKWVAILLSMFALILGMLVCFVERFVC